MKYVKIFSIAAIAALAFSCEKAVYPEYERGKADTEGKNEVYFVKASANEELDPNQETYVVEVARTQSEGALSVPVKVFDPEGIFEVPANIEFAAGEATSSITIGISKMQLEIPYELTLSIPEDYFAWYKNSEFSANNKFHLSALKQKWVDAGTCTFYDGNWYETLAAVDNVPIQNHEGTDDYRIVAPYAALDAESFAPANIIFQVKNNKVTHKAGIHDYWPGSGYYFYWDPDNYGAYCYIEVSPLQGLPFVEFNFLIAVGATPTYIGYIAIVWKDGPIKLEE